MIHTLGATIGCIPKTARRESGLPGCFLLLELAGLNGQQRHLRLGRCRNRVLPLIAEAPTPPSAP